MSHFFLKTFLKTIDVPQVYFLDVMNRIKWSKTADVTLSTKTVDVPFGRYSNYLPSNKRS